MIEKKISKVKEKLYNTKIKLLNKWHKKEKSILLNKRKKLDHWEDKENIDKEVKKIDEEYTLSKKILIKKRREQKTLNEWLSKHYDNVDINRLKNLWKNKSESIRDQFIDLCINNLAIIDGATKTNEAFKFLFNMPDVEIDIADLSKQSANIFRYKAISLILENSNLNLDERKKILRYIREREFSYKRNNKNNISQSYNNLKKLIMNEASKYTNK